jgi:hypothetical protein
MGIQLHSTHVLTRETRNAKNDPAKFELAYSSTARTNIPMQGTGNDRRLSDLQALELDRYIPISGLM